MMDDGSIGRDAELKGSARRLAQSLAIKTDVRPELDIYTHRQKLLGWLAMLREYCRDPHASHSRAADWLLDNDYQVMRAIKQVTEGLPPNFFDRLSVVENASGGTRTPRVFEIACALSAREGVQLSMHNVVQYVLSFQQVTLLSTSELWALPSMIRLANLEILAVAFLRLDEKLKPPFVPSRQDAAGEPADLVARAITNLSAVHAITWQDFFDQVSPVEATLKDDPAEVYAHMNFSTRDNYRKIVEHLADGSSLTDVEIARLALELSLDGAQKGPRNHVGYWLIGEGRCEIEKRASYKMPLGEWLGRRFRPYRQIGYVLALLLVVLLALTVPIIHLASIDAPVWTWIVGILLSLLPASVLSVSVVHWLIPFLIAPVTLPALDFRKSIPDICSAAVVVPVIISNAAAIRGIVELLETRWLANPDPNLKYVLLSDLSDAAQEKLPSDGEIEGALVAEIRNLNARHGGTSANPFFLMHRSRRYNAAEGCWMGWERKRGKLEQFNNVVLGGQPDDFSICIGETDALRQCRFVITLDADTMLPPGTAAQMVGTLAHPLNAAVYDEDTGRVASGYSILQPRIEILPSVSSETPFSHLCSGDTAIDIYTNAVSDVYQDMFGTGIFVGKGIYDVATVQRCLQNRLPENAILSHDLFEGLFCRTALVTNIVLYESFPSNYSEYAQRLHRWLRGDWQLIPWLAGKVPMGAGVKAKNPLSALDRWKIIDNLRRSLVPPALLLFLVGGWIVLPGNAWLWTLLAVAAPGIYLLGELFTGLARALQREFFGDMVYRLKERGGRWFLSIAFLVSDTQISLDAIFRTLWRLKVSRRHLLEWRTAADTAAGVSNLNPRMAAWRFMWPSSLFSVAVAIDLMLYDQAALLPAAPVLFLWFVAPEVAAWSGKPRLLRKEILDEDQSRFLLHVARRTWHYFETFAGPEDNWLPPDNYQEDPNGVVAHRTSPTNIGLYLVSALSARDFGFIGTADLASRARHVLDTLGRMETYRGHILNWYDTRNLQPLEPRYVSTVDSGNLAICLLALKNGCLESAVRPVTEQRLWNGLGCAFDLLLDALHQLSNSDEIETSKKVFRKHLSDAADSPEQWQAILDQLSNHFWPQFEKTIGAALKTADAPASQALSDLHVWLERFEHHLRAMRRDFDMFLPWLKILEDSPAGQENLIVGLLECLHPIAPTQDNQSRCQAMIDAAQRQEPADSPVSAWLEALKISIGDGLEAQQSLQADLVEIARRADEIAYGMNFVFLYDPEVRLFRIGFNLSSGHLDASCYDLLATEARLASFFAIAKLDVPMEHWFYLGRPITRLDGKPSILSWNGSMFEYLMPPLFLPGKRDTLLGESESTAVTYQRRYARDRGVPWGISESAFGVTDAEGNYQYRAFGAPGLGIRRGLTNDLVVAPYASALALCVWPGAAVENLQLLKDTGASGTYGFFDALDFTPDRAPRRGGFVPVKTYMAHHHGMTIAAISNVLGGDVLIRRVLQEKRLRAVEYLLQERIPWGLPTELGRVDEAWDTGAQTRDLPHLAPWIPSSAATVPQSHLIGNGRMSMRLSEAGGGGLSWNQMALTRWLPDPTRDAHGYWLYVHDVRSKLLWSVGRRPIDTASGSENTIFHQHKVEMLRREHGLTTHMEATVAPGDDVEIRHITVTNEQDVERVIEFTTYAEVVLAPPLDDERHPAFSKMFVGSTYLPDQDGLLFERRPRRPEMQYPVLLHKLLTDDPDIGISSYETERGNFIGRNGTMDSPRGLREGLSRSTGWTLDPIMALQIRMRLKPLETKEFSLLTIVANTRAAVLEVARKYQTPDLEWVFGEASRDFAREVSRLEIDPRRLPELQALSSLLVHPSSRLREPPASLEANRFGQPDLWRFGISGDLPILLMRIGDEEGSALLDLLVRAQQLWRHGGLQADIVMLRTGTAGYEEPVRDRILSILRDAHAYGFLGRSGGIHLLSESHMDADSRKAIEAAAHVVLHEGHEALAETLDRVLERRGVPPRFEPPVPARFETTVPLARPEGLEFDNGYGGFDTNKKEYVIHLEPGMHTPAPWCNVLANDTFGSIVTEAGLGFTWAINSGENRLTPWSNDPVMETPGEVLYLRDEATADVWSVSPAPRSHETACQISHGLGYTTWKQHSHALEQEMLAFVPVDDPVKIVRLRLQNTSGQSRRITATYYAEWLLGALGSTAKPHILCTYDPGLHAILANNGWNPEFAARLAFLAASKPPHSVSGDRQEFLGHEGGPDDPAALRHWDLGGGFPPGGDACAAYQVHLELIAGQTAEVIFVLGQGADRAETEALIRRWQQPDKVEMAFEALRQSWKTRLDTVQVTTPDPAFDLMVNQWLPYQTLSSRVMARAGFYQAGGAFGFRDQLQDSLALLHSEPARVRAHILRSASHQFEEGDALHWWHPPFGRGVRTRCSDDYLWLVYVTGRYIEATGDTSILEVDVPFLCGPELRPDQQDLYAHFATGETQSLFEHCARALDRMVVTGRHGLPLIGTGDWNDGMDRVGMNGQGESVWLAWFQIAIVGKFGSIADKHGDKSRADGWRLHAQNLKLAIDENAWDGAWFIRAFDDNGEAWGSQMAEECQIDSIAQSWSVLSGLPVEDRMRTAVASAAKRLVNDDKRLIKLLDPPFHHTMRDPGYIKAYPPGIRENGGQYTHAAVWLGLAFAGLDDGDTAWRLFDIINPIRRAAKKIEAERYAREPYVLTGDVSALESKEGLGGWSWYTGAAGWTWQLGVEGILGLKLVAGAIQVDPCLPEKWGGAQLTLKNTRGSINITIEDPEHVGKGVLWITADGKRLRGSSIRFPGKNRSRNVVVRLG